MGNLSLTVLQRKVLDYLRGGGSLKWGGLGGKLQVRAYLVRQEGPYKGKAIEENVTKSVVSLRNKGLVTYEEGKGCSPIVLTPYGKEFR